MGIGIGDVMVFYGTLIALGIALPGLWMAWSLLLSGTVERARLRLQHTPVKCFGLGIVWLVPGALIVAILVNLKAGPIQFVGYVWLFLLLALISIGAAGLVTLMGERLQRGNVNASSAGAFLRAALALELALVFPLVGWFIVMPLVAIASLGAAAFALLHWMPRVQPSPVSQPPMTLHLPQSPA